jgi:hypothetical protein
LDIGKSNMVGRTHLVKKQMWSWVKYSNNIIIWRTKHNHILNGWNVNNVTLIFNLWLGQGKHVRNSPKQGRHPNTFPLWKGIMRECKRGVPKPPKCIPNFGNLETPGQGQSCNFEIRSNEDQTNCLNWTFFKPLQRFLNNIIIY